MIMSKFGKNYRKVNKKSVMLRTIFNKMTFQFLLFMCYVVIFKHNCLHGICDFVSFFFFPTWRVFFQISEFLENISYLIDIPYLFNNLLIRHLGCFQFFTIINYTENNFLYRNTCTCFVFLG